LGSALVLPESVLVDAEESLAWLQAAARSRGVVARATAKARRGRRRKAIMNELLLRKRRHEVARGSGRFASRRFHIVKADF
jgi:hypothetical protein